MMRLNMIYVPWVQLSSHIIEELMIKQSYSFDDLLLVPKFSEVKSRSLVDTSVEINGVKYSQPIIPANMQTVVGLDMVLLLVKQKSLAIMHRFCSIEHQLEVAKEALKFGAEYFAVSVGVLDKDKENISKFYDAGVRIFCIDIAHGDSSHCIDMIKFIKQFEGTTIIAGNVATGKAAERLWNAGATIVKVGIGGGCFGPDTRVLMSNGYYKNIKDIVPGDYVINKNGKPVKVLHAFCSGIKKVAKLKNNSFYKDTLVTPDHKFWVKNADFASKKSKWKAISKIKKDSLLFPSNIKFQMPKTFEIVLSKKANLASNNAITPNDAIGYLFGTFLGNGSVNNLKSNAVSNGKISWSFAKEQINAAQKTINCIKEVFNQTAEFSNNSENIIKVSFYNKEFAEYLNSFDKKEKKFLPENLLVNNKEYLLGLYNGLLDSDGTHEKDGTTSLASSSSKIIELFNVLNYILFNHLPKNSFKSKGDNGLNNSYEAKTIKNYKKSLTKNAFAVKKLGYKELDLEMPVYDITVDCDTHSFIANNMIVHNSTCLTRVRTANGVAQMTAIMDVSEAKKRIEKIYSKKVYFISDGGCKESGDICKALCFADMVMVGNLFAGTTEAPGNVVFGSTGALYKEYVGSSTHKSHYVEGVKGMVPFKGGVLEVLEELLEGLRSCCSYQGCDNLIDLKEDPEFMSISSAGLKESKAHDVTVSLV